ncbi:MAG: hypothetical protein KGY99_10120 [Phycisphaerae bacterium]|nr:hypothetical protein [Phycisphaerae bacterium]
MSETTWAKAATVVAALLCGAVAARAEDGIHLPDDRKTSFTWSAKDAAGYKWDILHDGRVNDGTHDAYDGGMQLRVDGQVASQSGQGRLSADGREVETSVWTRGSLHVSRRVYVDGGDDAIGYCRWIDIFENTGSSEQTVTVEYFSDMGNTVQYTYTTSGKSQLVEGDWGIVTSDHTGNSSRPAVVHVFASEGSPDVPTFTWSGDDIRCTTQLKIPAGETVALCIFQAQRRSFSDAKKLLDEFDPRRELRKVPPALRRRLVNMSGALLMLGAMELPRDEEHDLLVLDKGDRIPGRIGNEQYAIETAFGEFAFPAERVVGLQATGSGALVRMGLVDGQVLVGTLTNGPITFHAAAGGEMNVPADKMATVAYRVSPDRPERIALAGPMIALRSGARLLFSPEDFPGAFLCEYGKVRLVPEHLEGVKLSGVEGLHRALFRNGSVLSGLWLADPVVVPLSVGRTLRVARGRVEKIVCATDRRTEPCVELALRNDDVLRGRIVEDVLPVRTRYGRIDAKPAQVKSMHLDVDEGLGRVKLELRNGTNVSGRLERRSIRFQVAPGCVLPVFVGHIQALSCPDEGLMPPAPSTRPAASTRPANGG